MYMYRGSSFKTITLSAIVKLFYLKEFGIEFLFSLLVHVRKASRVRGK